MAFHVEVMPRARQDLVRIYQYVHAADSQQARAWFNGMETLVASLNEQPNRGAVTREDATIRQLLNGTKPYVYRVIYRVLPRARRVEVLHIRHGARDAFQHKTR
jgi:plasmid stabilization system protein ParE